jgi:DNA helicase-2/ATP-dependent DNA helicase PcrA
MNELLADLTDAQRRAVTHTDGPLLVLAGAGSGKTRVITRRAAYLATTVARPGQVVAITFTNKAAGEMRERVEQLGIGRGMVVSTFHSLCARLLRECAGRVGLKSNFSIYDQTDRLVVIQDALHDCSLSTDHWRPRSIEHRISQAKNQMVSAEQFAEQAHDFSSREVARVYRRYEQLMRERNACDFDDLLVFAARLLGEHADVRDALEERWPYVLIDEYQDTNHPQYLIATRLVQRQRNICATGDPDQSIYGWRGADIGNILSFEEDYPDAVVVRLEENFRSTPKILGAASSLIEHNLRRKHKALWTRNPEGPDVAVWPCEDEHDEAERVAEEIARHIADGGRAGDVAIFYRINALTRVLEDALRRAKIPYQIARGVEFYARKEIKDALAYLRLIVNPEDDTAAKRITNNPPRGIGKTTVDRLLAHARWRKCSLLTAVQEAETIAEVKTAHKKLKGFADLMTDFRGRPLSPVKELVEYVLRRSGLEEALRNDPDPEKQALANVSELVTAAAEFDAENPESTLAEWLEQISLVSDVDRLDLEGGTVTLMTLHAAKGLEFPLVFIVGFEDELIPHRRALQDEGGDLEEERRLCFVGMTRAKKRLTLSFAKYRTIRGFSQRAMKSRFLRELPLGDLEYAASEETRGDGYDPHPTIDAEDLDLSEWKPGRRVNHAEYGDGEVVGIEPRGRGAWVRVRFDEGDKVFAIEHAPLSFVEYP